MRALSRRVITWGLAAGLLAVSVFLLFCRVVTVSGISMEGTLRSGDRLLVFRTDFVPAALVTRLVGRGHIVVARDPVRARRAIVKRVVGIGGDQLSIRAGHVFLNGSLLSDPGTVMPSQQDWPAPSVDRRDVIVPARHYFLLADNRDFATDSRLYGAVYCDAILGVVVGVWRAV